LGGACNNFWGEKRFWWGHPRERNHFEDLGVEGKIILKWTFKKWNVTGWGREVEVSQDTEK
jgi:hypothetical protein